MDNLNLNLLRIFMLVATTNSFLEASKKLYISQPAISKNIKILEDELNVSLFYRDNKGICLTPDGEILFKYVKDAFNLLKTAEKMIDQENNFKAGTIVIGAKSDIVHYYLLEKIIKFRDKYPNIKINVVDLGTSDLLEALEKHSVDLIIDLAPIETIYNNILIKPVACLDTCFIKSTNYKHEYNDSVILPLENSALRKALEDSLEKTDIKFSPILEFETDDLIVEAVKKDLGIGFVVENSVKDLIKDNKVEKVELIKNLPKLNVNLVYIESHLNNVTKLFIDEFIMEKDCK